MRFQFANKALKKRINSRKFFPRAIDYSLPSLLAGLSASAIHSLFTKELSVGTWISAILRCKSIREEIIKDSGLDPHHGAFFPFPSLSPLEKEKSQHISTGTAVALIWGIFCKTSHFKVFVGCKLLIFGIEKEKLMLKIQFQTKRRYYSGFFRGIH